MKVDLLVEPLFKERSYVKSISVGMRLPLRHPWGFLRHLWPLLLVCMIIWGLAANWLAPDLWAFQQQLVAHGITADHLIGTPLYRMLLWLFAAILILGVQVGQVAYLMQRYGELTYLPAVQPWKVWRDILPNVCRGILACSFGYVVTAGLLLLSLSLVSTRIWAFSLFFLLMFLWAMVYVPFGQQLLLGKRSVADSAKYCLTHFGDMGSLAAVLMVCGLLVVVVMFVGFLPAISTVYVGGISDRCIAMGDVSDLPDSFPLLRSISFLLGAFFVFVSWLFLLVPLTFQWGSSESVDKTE